MEFFNFLQTQKKINTNQWKTISRKLEKKYAAKRFLDREDLEKKKL